MHGVTPGVLLSGRFAMALNGSLRLVLVVEAGINESHLQVDRHVRSEGRWMQKRMRLVTPFLHPSLTPSASAARPG
jgi:hypothetical protein